MHLTCSRLGGLCAGLVVAMAAAVGAAPASAAVTSSKITSPTGGFFQNNLDSADPQVIHVEGVTNGTTGDTVDIVCVASSSSAVLETGVPVNADGTFSTDAPYNNSSSYRTGSCELKAVDVWWNSSVARANFTGPHINYSQFDSYQINTGGGPNDGNTYDYDLYTSQPGGGADYESAGDCGIDYSWLYPQGHGFYSADYWTGPWDCNGYFNNTDSGLYNTSEIVVDGHNAYTPYGAQNINSTGTGLPKATITQSVDPVTGVMTATETDELAYCANADESINDAYSPGCDHWIAAPVKLTRGYVENHDGRQTTMTDQWQSTDGASHPVRLQYQEDFNYCYFQMPGESGADDCNNGAGREVSLPATAPATIYAYNYPGDAPSDNQTGALTYMDKPDRVVFSYYEGLVRVYNRTVPAGGSLTEQTVYSMGMKQSEAAALAQKAQGASSAPSLAITSPANNAVVNDSTVMVTGTASDDQAVTSLTVNGTPTVVGSDGRWSQGVSGLKPGANTITATASDSGGNATTVSETVVYSPPAAPKCTAPNVKGMTAAAAKTAIEAAGCTVGRTTARPSTIKKGSIVSQSRPAGTTLPAYYPIELVRSSGRLATPRLVTKSTTLKGRVFAIKIACPKLDGNACSGTLRVRTVKRVAGFNKLGRIKSYRVAAGRTKTYTYTMSSGVARRLHAAGDIPSLVFMSHRTTAGKTVATRRHLLLHA